MKLLLFCVSVIFLANCAVFESKMEETKRLECTPVDSLGCSGWE